MEDVHCHLTVADTSRDETHKIKLFAVLKSRIRPHHAQAVAAPVDLSAPGPPSSTRGPQPTRPPASSPSAWPSAGPPQAPRVTDLGQMYCLRLGLRDSRATKATTPSLGGRSAVTARSAPAYRPGPPRSSTAGGAAPADCRGSCAAARPDCRRRRRCAAAAGTALGPLAVGRCREIPSCSLRWSTRWIHGSALQLRAWKQATRRSRSLSGRGCVGRSS